jgi:hypothetical protein
MSVYPAFLAVMETLFGLAALVLIVMSVVCVGRRGWRRAAGYLGLTVVACAVAAGFHFFRMLF